MTVLMRFAAFLFRHPVIMVLYGIFATWLESWLCAEAIQLLAPDWWTPAFEMWFGLSWLIVGGLWVAYMAFMRVRFGWLFQQLFGNIA